MRIICFILFSLLSAVTYGSGVKEPQSIKGKWVNLAVCQTTDFLIFNFTDKEITTLNGDVHQFKMSKKSFNVSVSDSIIHLDYKKILISDDTIKLFLGNNTVIPLVKYKKLKLAGFGDKKAIGDFFLHTLLESTDSVRNISWYFDFVSNESLVMTAMVHKKKDTLGYAHSWNIYLVDSICVLAVGDIFCSRLFIGEVTGSSIIAYSVAISFSSINFRLIKIIYKNRSDIILRTDLKERLIGNWEVKENSSTIYDEISTLRFTEDQILLNEGLPRPFGEKWKSPWYLDKFRKTIVTNLDGLNWIHLVKLDEKLVIETGHSTYVLEKKL